MNFNKAFIQYVKEWEAKINAFIELNLEPSAQTHTGGVSVKALPKNAAALVSDIPFAVRDNIAVNDWVFTCGSKLLEQLRSPYTATIVQKLERAGGIAIGKTNLDEFGMGCTAANSAIKKTNNPWNIDTAGDDPTDGSAAAVAAGIVPYALGIDSGGSIRQPAAFCGIAGLKPTYGAVSRYGLAAYASSLETAGILADTIARCRAVFAIIRGRDHLDQTSHEAPDVAPPLYDMAVGCGKKIGVFAPDANVEDKVRRGFELVKERLTALGHNLVDIEIPCLRYSVPAFYTIAAAEAGSNLSRFDGIRFGKRPDWAENPDELVDKARAAGFGDEVKLQILLGAFVLRSGFQERYYWQAQRIRTAVKRNFESLLGDSEYTQQATLDAILMPVFPKRTFGRESLSAVEQKKLDVYTCGANLAGLPALAFPVSEENAASAGGSPLIESQPIGVQLVGRAWAEGTLLDIAEAYEQKYPFPHPAGYKALWGQE
ncbi:MAG: Asp-tRNA(Asn)/Glu-tRNA(Gln) amidotransferase subunit GatA [Treponema sp.]|jgi:aspartyl-tRNA(Asn)/glutamyl-tRNA(Gln) amidotransferase subunit A|nr:Asp-tRNA(Asn)/Glu-tRNA(Gln) amidotransferase subunit GatA [Treponema sp.]